jgi:exonuclease VII small subunit
MALAALVGVMKHKDWQEKDLVGALAFARAGTHFGLQSALLNDQTDPELAYKLRSRAKGCAYDFASNAWSGWDEPGIFITQSDHEAGFDAPRVNLRLAIELERGDLPASRAHWMVGAYHLEDGAYDQAIASFEEGMKFARQAGSQADEMLNQGYILVARLLVSPEDSASHEDYETLKSSFQEIERCESFIQQLDTALKVFSPQAD